MMNLVDSLYANCYTITIITVISNYLFLLQKLNWKIGGSTCYVHVSVL